MSKRTDDSFRDILCTEEGGARILCYRTNLTVYEEKFQNGMYTAAGWNSAGYMLNVQEYGPTRLNPDAFALPQAFDIEVDGESLAWDFEWATFTQSEEKTPAGAPLTHSVVTLRSALKPLTVKIHTLLDGTPFLTRFLEIQNTGDRPLSVSALSPFCGGAEATEGWKGYMRGAPNPERIYSLGYMDYAQWGHEGAFRWRDMPNGEFGIASKFRRDRHRHPVFFLRNNLTGSLFCGQLAWPGGWRFQFDLDADTDTSLMSLRMELDSPKPLIRLAPGETFESPQVFIGMIQGDLDDAVNGMHEHMRRSVFTLPAARGRLGWVEGGFGADHPMTVDVTNHNTDTMALVGAETMIIDAGWYCPPGTEQKEWWTRAGDWTPDPERYPNGIAEIRDYIHEKGLLFGLWLDLERLGPTSRMAKTHPEWISESFVHGRKTTQLNMAIPQAAAWAEEELARVLTEYKVDLFRLDYNLGVAELVNRCDAGYGPECNYIRYYQNTISMYKRLRERFPNVVFENCAGGGGRTDAAFLTNFTHTWVSDWNIAPRSLAIVNGMTMCLPPETVDRLVGGMNCHTRASIDFQARVTLFGRPTSNNYNAMGSRMNPQQLGRVKRAFDIYKEYILPWAGEDRMYHHTPEMAADGESGIAPHPRGTGIIERAAKNKRHGILGIFRLADPIESVTTVFPRGLDPALEYEVTYDNSGAVARFTGAELLNHGLRIRLEGALVSELILYKAVE